MGFLIVFFIKKNCYLMIYILIGVFDDILNVVKMLVEILWFVINVGVYVIVVVFFVS